MKPSNSFFSKLVDELVEFSEHDEELAEGLKWIDETFCRDGKINFYDAVFKLLYKVDQERNTKKWVKDHSN